MGLGCWSACESDLGLSPFVAPFEAAAVPISHPLLPRAGDVDEPTEWHGIFGLLRRVRLR